MSEVEMSNIDLVNSMLNSSWDDIEDLPEFETFVPGVYQFKCEKMEVATDTENDKIAVKGLFSLEHVIETSQPLEDGEEYKEGSLLGGLWSKDFGIKKFKKVFRPAIEETGAATPVHFIDSCEGLSFVFTLGQRKDTNGKVDDEGNPLVYNDIKVALLAS